MRQLVLALLLTVVVVPASAAGAAETLRYEWRLRSPFSWIARIKFPTSGAGVLRTEQTGAALESSLRVSAGGHDYFEYRSTMERDVSRTLTSRSGYAFGSKREVKETIYDYAAGVARTADQDEGVTEIKTRPLTQDEARDALTIIAYLRQHAARIRSPLSAEVFSDGKRYPVTIQPKGTRTYVWNRQQVPAAVFEVVPAGQQKDGGFTLWLSKDERRLPLRIILEQKYGSLDLRLR